MTYLKDLSTNILTNYYQLTSVHTPSFVGLYLTMHEF